MSEEGKDTDFQAFQSPHEASVERLVQALDRAYHRPGLLMWRAFLQGLMTALGLTIGYGLIIIVLAYLIQVHGGLSKILTPLTNEVEQRIVPGIVQQSQTNSDTSSK